MSEVRDQTSELFQNESVQLVDYRSEYRADPFALSQFFYGINLQTTLRPLVSGFRPLISDNSPHPLICVNLCNLRITCFYHKTTYDPQITPISRIINKTFVLKGFCSEIDQEADRESSCFQIIDELCFIGSRQTRDCFYFDYDISVTNKIRLIGFIQRFAFV